MFYPDHVMSKNKFTYSFSQNHSSVENGCICKVSILLEIHRFFTSQSLWEEGYFWIGFSQMIFHLKNSHFGHLKKTSGNCHDAGAAGCRETEMIRGRVSPDFAARWLTCDLLFVDNKQVDMWRFYSICEVLDLRVVWIFPAFNLPNARLKLVSFFRSKVCFFCVFFRKIGIWYQGLGSAWARLRSAWFGDLARCVSRWFNWWPVFAVEVWVQSCSFEGMLLEFPSSLGSCETLVESI